MKEKNTCIYEKNKKENGKKTAQDVKYSFKKTLSKEKKWPLSKSVLFP